MRLRKVLRGRFAWIGSRRLGAVAVLVVIASGVAAQGASALTSLVITGPAFSSLGLAPASSSARAARGALVSRLSPRLATAVGAASVQTTGAAGRGERVSSDAFVFGSKSLAASVLRAWQHAHHAGTVAVGGGGALAVGPPRGQVEVLWHDGPRLGLIVLRARRAGSGTRSTAVSLAFVADRYLRSVLPRTAWETVLNQIRPNGTVSRATALQAFAVAYGGLPGVRLPKGARGTIASGTLAAQWLLQYRSRLSAAQRLVVDRRLGLQKVNKTVRAADLGDPGFDPDPGIESIANAFAATEGADLGHTLGLTIVAGYSDANVPAFADSLPLNAKGDYGSGAPTTCRIRVLPSDLQKSDAFRRLTIAHEVFHCFEFDLRGAATWTPLPPWIGEGAADWAALTVDPVNYAEGGGNLMTYITMPQTPLFERSYDAVGFWGHVQETFGSLWTLFPAIFNAGSNAAAYEASGASGSGFLDSWGSSPLLVPNAGAAWNIASPIDAATGNAVAPVQTIYPANVVEVDAPPYTTSQYEVVSELSTPLLHVEVAGHARLGALDPGNYTDLEDEWFCTDPEGCMCPEGTTGELPPTRPLPPTAALGVSGGPEGGSHGILHADTLGQFCEPDPPPKDNRGGGGGGGGGSSGDDGSAGSEGDPHLFDFAGDLFDFQQAGEFTLLKSTDDDFEVQVRQQPFPHSRTVAINTAVAVRAGGATVEIALGRRDVVASVNHRAVRDGTYSVGGGHFFVTPTEGTLLTRDGSVITISNSPTSNAVDSPVTPALGIDVTLSRRRRRHLTGLLGNWGVASADEFAGSDGRHFPAAVITGYSPASDAIRYGGFGRSWRITQSKSLFVYPRGKSTSSYNVRGFPAADETEADLPPKALAAGEAACNGVGGADLQVFGACVLDVGATGDRTFAAADAALGQRTGVSGGGKATSLHPIDLGPGSTRPVAAYDPGSKDTYVAWISDDKSVIDLCVLPAGSSTCNGGAGPYALSDPMGNIEGYDGLYYSVAVVVLPGGTVAVIGEVEGANSVIAPAGYDSASGSVVWSSPAGGAAFATSTAGIANGGQILSEAAGRTPSGGAIALDGTHIGVYGDTDGSGFSDFTLGAPAPATTPAPDLTDDFTAQLGVESGQLASVPDPAVPGEFIVVAVGGDYGEPPGCPSGTPEGTGFGVGVGTPAALATQSAWAGRYFVTLRCNAISPVLAGGGVSGGTIGLLEDEDSAPEGTGSTGVYYRRFNASSLTFGSPILVSNETKRVLGNAPGLSLSTDADGGLYAAWNDSRGIVLSHSASGGATWTAPVPVALKGFSMGYNDVSVLGTGAGDAVMVYTAGTGSATHVYIARVDSTTGAGAG